MRDDLYTLPEGLPVPVDDGAADHLEGLPLPDVELESTAGPSPAGFSLQCDAYVQPIVAAVTPRA